MEEYGFVSFCSVVHIIKHGIIMYVFAATQQFYIVLLLLAAYYVTALLLLNGLGCIEHPVVQPSAVH